MLVWDKLLFWFFDCEFRICRLNLWVFNKLFYVLVFVGIRWGLDSLVFSFGRIGWDVVWGGEVGEDAVFFAF